MELEDIYKGTNSNLLNACIYLQCHSKALAHKLNAHQTGFLLYSDTYS